MFFLYTHLFKGKDTHFAKLLLTGSDSKQVSKSEREKERESDRDIGRWNFGRNIQICRKSG